MVDFYCDVADVGSRLSLDASQRTRAQTRIERHIRQASIYIDQTFKEYGRDEPSDHIAETTLNGAVSAGATTITLTSASSFSTAGNGNIDGDSFTWTGKSSNDLTGCTGISFSHLTGVKVQEGEMAHVLREVCADLAAASYLEDEGTMQTNADGGLRGQALRQRAKKALYRLAHMGSA
jgi:hypothetical protein